MITTMLPSPTDGRPGHHRLEQATLIITGAVASAVTVLSVEPSWWLLGLSPVVALLWAWGSALTTGRLGSRLLDLAVLLAGGCVVGLALAPAPALAFGVVMLLGRLVLGGTRRRRLTRLGRRDRPADRC